MDKIHLNRLACQLVSEKRGILAADWSLGTATKHFEKNGIESTKENRRRYRQMLLTTPNLGNYISGAILHEETLKQKTDDNIPFSQLLQSHGIFPGIRVDTGTKDFANFPREKFSSGLDDLRERLTEYKNLGAQFAKFRCVYLISTISPSRPVVDTNADILARYAALCQEQDIVPIIEPEVLMDGDHSMKASKDALSKVLKVVFSKLFDHKVYVDGILLKTNMVHPGKGHKVEPSDKKIAEATLKVLNDSVGVGIPGVVFLSGGMKPKESTRHLNVINKLKDNAPWQLTFSYARALQYPAIEIWGGKDENVERAQKAVIFRAQMNSLARQGKYDLTMEKNEEG